jgi:hypothetical protein
MAEVNVRGSVAAPDIHFGQTCMAARISSAWESALHPVWGDDDLDMPDRPAWREGWWV